MAFFHPDLGIGGAERLVVDAALSLLGAGNHTVRVFAGFHQPLPHRCFPETMPGGSVPVTVYGAWIPRSVCGHLHVVMSWIRMLYVVIRFTCSGEFHHYDVAVCDQVSLVVPFLKHLLRFKVLFYCHFPDMLLASRGSCLRRLYRWPFDALERWSTGCADALAVNSQFTALTVKKHMPKLAHRQMHILYPPVQHMKEVEEEIEPLEECSTQEGQVDSKLGLLLQPDQVLLLSINRYEKKKDLPAALHTLSALMSRWKNSLRGLAASDVVLVFAGGYDTRVPENEDCLSHLRCLAKELNLEDQVFFLQNISSNQKMALLKRALCVLYTPPMEHFGIVPVEAMMAGCPVIAIASGGPTESILHERTGFLVPEGDIQAMADAVERLLREPGLAHEMGELGRQHATETFSLDIFGRELEGILEELCTAPAS